MLQLQPTSVSLKLDDGREITIETGKLARQADGAVTVRMGNSILLATVVANHEPKPGQSFFPLSVDYQEKFASAGKIQVSCRDENRDSRGNGFVQPRSGSAHGAGMHHCALCSFRRSV